eukprot:227207-Pleurochrysis_carterae.AAC.1
MRVIHQCDVQSLAALGKSWPGATSQWRSEGRALVASAFVRSCADLFTKLHFCAVLFSLCAVRNNSRS